MIQLIKNVSELSGTCYFEFLPGIFADKHWNKESVFIEDLEIFYIEPILSKHINNYDHYSFMVADKYTWKQIINDLNLQKEVLRKASNFDEYASNLSFAFHYTDKYFTENFEEIKINLMRMIDDLVIWLNKILKNHNQISVLGI